MDSSNILALVLIARITDGYLWGIFASLIGVVCVNFLFTYPYLALNFTLAGYPVTFIGMLAISLITSAATTHMKQQMQMLAERERLLVEAEKEKMRANQYPPEVSIRNTGNQNKGKNI